MEILTVKNRTNSAVTGMWDGRQYTLEPLATGAFPEVVAKAFKRQNPIMGTGDPRDAESGMTGRMQYKVGIVELNDPTDPVAVDPNAVERWNRDYLIGTKPSQVVAGDNGLYSGRDVSTALPLSPTIMTAGDR